MNPFALFFLAAMAGSTRTRGNQPGISSLRLDTLVNQLQGAISTLEKVNELSRLGSSVTVPSAAAPASAHIPLPAEAVEDYSEPVNNPPPALQNLDLQNIMQTLGPILSMLGNNQNSR